MPTITNQNLAEFMESTKLDNGFDYDFHLSDEVRLEDYFAEFENKTDTEKRHLVAVAERSLNLDTTEKRKKEIFDLAHTNRAAFASWYKYSGNGHNYNGCYECANSIAKKNKFAENLYLIETIVDLGEMVYPYGQNDDTQKLPKDKAEILAKIFALAKSASIKSEWDRTPQEVSAASFVKGVLSKSYLLNYEPKNVNVAGITAQEIRAMINEHITAKNIIDLDKKFIFDGKRANKDLLRLLFNNQLNKDEFVQTNGEQKAHDAKEMRKYVETRDLVLDAAESVVGKYIPNSRGEKRTNTQKFKALIEEFYGQPFEYTSLGNVGKDYLLSAAYRDINAGNAAKLEDDELRLVLEHDKDGYWLQKINENSPETAKKIIFEMNRSFNARQSRVADMIAPEITLNYGNNDLTGDIFANKTGNLYNEYKQGVAASKHMSTTEKEEFLDKAAAFVEENLLKKAKEDKAFADEFRKDYAEHEELRHQADAKEELKCGLTSLQELYANIVKKFDNGNPNEAEKHLTPKNMEEVLKDFPNCQGINLPAQGKLPLLFGRKKEEGRRMELAQAIDKFNDKLREFQNDAKNPEVKWAKFADLSEYKGKLLEPSTIMALSAERDALNEKYRADSQMDKYARKGMYNLHDADRADEILQKQEKKAKAIETEKQKVLEHKQKLLERKQKLTSDMDKDTKAEVRAANKQINDSLEKPVTERIKKVRNVRD